MRQNVCIWKREFFVDTAGSFSPMTYGATPMDTYIHTMSVIPWWISHSSRGFKLSVSRWVNTSFSSLYGTTLNYSRVIGFSLGVPYTRRCRYTYDHRYICMSSKYTYFSASPSQRKSNTCKIRQCTLQREHTSN